MKKNMGGLDRIVRVLFAILITVLFFTGLIHGVFGIILLVLAGILVLTSMVSICPLYMPFGINSCPKKEES